MHISIDMDGLRFLHKHADHETVSKLAWLECGQNISVRIDNTEHDQWLRSITHSDLIRLYANTTGDDTHELTWGDRAFQFRERLREAARNMAQTVALVDEVSAQVAAVEDRLYEGERFKYALGAKVPAQAGELFPLPFIPLAPTQTTAADTRAAESVRQFKEHLEAERRGDFLPASARVQAGLAPLEGAPTPAADTPPPAPKAPKARSVQPVVYAACEAAWSDPNRTDDWPAVKARLFQELSGQGLHPTTVRIKLSNWAKEKGL